jgi:hypothetical protein
MREQIEKSLQELRNINVWFAQRTREFSDFVDNLEFNNYLQNTGDILDSNKQTRRVYGASILDTVTNSGYGGAVRNINGDTGGILLQAAQADVRTQAGA